MDSGLAGRRYLITGASGGIGRATATMLSAEGSELVLSTFLATTVIAVTVGMLAVHWFMRNRRLEEVVPNAPWWLTGLVWAGMLFLIVITQGSGDAFIYFQF